MENQPFRYKLRACALHHGMHIHSGHYTAVIFHEGKVIEIDDDKATDLTDDWIYCVQSTVYLAFYSKNYASSTYSSKLYNAPCPKNDRNEKEKGSTSESSAKEHNGGSQPIVNVADNTECVYDISYKYKHICSVQSEGYDLVGEDLKTLEFPVLNHTYTVDRLGWLNDRVVDAYLYILVDAASKNGCRVHAFNTFFFPRLWQIVIREGSELILNHTTTY